jgi:hypothetical protein
MTPNPHRFKSVCPVALAALGLFAGAACGSTATVSPALAPVTTAAEELDAEHRRHVVGGLEGRRFQPEEYWDLAADLLNRAPDRFRISEIGRSIEGRPLRRVDFGSGEITVLLWSQMHGDESTASRALLDVFDYLISRPDDPRVQRIEDNLAVTVIPVLNPDGAARFVRHNAVGIDINRDARVLSTPEGRALKSVRDDISAQWGFNLHDQNIRTRRGRTDEGVQIALLTPPPGDGVTSPPNQNAKSLASLMVGALRPVVGDAIARYSESFNPRAFGDLITQWGTGTILIESGGGTDDPNKELPRRANFVAILSALDGIATGAWREFPPDAYQNLPPNGRAFIDLLIQGARIVLPGREPIRADVTVRFEDAIDRTGGVVVEVGDLTEVEALEVLSAEGLYLVPHVDVLSPEHGPHLRPGDTLDGVISRDPEGRQVVYRLEAGRPVPVER